MIYLMCLKSSSKETQYQGASIKNTTATSLVTRNIFFSHLHVCRTKQVWLKAQQQKTHKMFIFL